MTYYPYCERCLKQPNAKTKEFYDYRFDTPVCIECVEAFNLTPDEVDAEEVDISIKATQYMFALLEKTMNTPKEAPKPDGECKHDCGCERYETPF